MEVHHPGNGKLKQELEAQYDARLNREVAAIREKSREAVEQFKQGFPPPTDAQIEQMLYPELSEFTLEIGNREFILRELPALVEKKLLRLIEQKLPEVLAEILSFDERMSDNATAAFGALLGRAGTALDLISEACVLVLDPAGEAAITKDWIQGHASTSRQLRILQAQLSLNGARDFLSRLFPGWIPSGTAPRDTPTPAPSPVGSSSFENPRRGSQTDSPLGNSQPLGG
jgi:hypothetical protein